MTDIKILPAAPDNAPAIATAFLMAVGDDIAKSFAGKSHTMEEVHELISELARMDNSQYSYRNALVAVDEEGRTAGVIICYDGAQLHQLREPFIRMAKEKLDYRFDTLQDETSDDEIYLDTLAVFPEFRNRGIAAMLIDAACEKAAVTGKPIGLLVDKTNHRARKLYEKSGFLPVGERPFAGEPMDHLQKKLDR